VFGLAFEKCSSAKKNRTPTKPVEQETSFPGRSTIFIALCAVQLPFSFELFQMGANKDT